MFCPNCGAQVKDGASFCGNCGTPLVKQDSQPSSPESEIPQEPLPSPEEAAVSQNVPPVEEVDASQNTPSVEEAAVPQNAPSVETSVSQNVPSAETNVFQNLAPANTNTKKGNVFIKNASGAHQVYFAFASCTLIIALFLPWFTVTSSPLASMFGPYGGSYVSAALGILSFEYTPLAFFGLLGSINSILQTTISTLSNFNVGEYAALQNASMALSAAAAITIILWIASFVLLALDAMFRFKNKGGTIIAYIVTGVFALLAIVVGFVVDNGVSTMVMHMSDGAVVGNGLFGATFWPWAIAASCVALIVYHLKEA